MKSPPSAAGTPVGCGAAMTAVGELRPFLRALQRELDRANQKAQVAERFLIFCPSEYGKARGPAGEPEYPTTTRDR